jgi:SEC-C motif-containing protein
LPYAECCEPYHAGQANAPTAEVLMRSRFSAFAKNDEEYLLRTWFPGTRPKTLNLDASTRWTRLEILATSAGSLFDSSGTVLFEAHYRQDGKPGVLREDSTFKREEGQWFYVRALSVGDL